MSPQDFPVGYVVVSVAVPDDLSILSEDAIRAEFPDAGPQELGDRWLKSFASCVLRVRSAIVPAEFNFLLNPRHPEFARIVAEEAYRLCLMNASSGRGEVP